ncbi:MAG TPA: glycerophosphodiester phosphodiesterase [Steroidobacteraceae bacterium]|nr:glycerophosphodiester phosphodiesterase [Steroidobacteraceae bacterium]
MSARRLSTSSAVARRDKPIVIAHRGASGYAPEHTLASYVLAILQGADYIEPDLVSTRDGVLVARHENEIGGTTDVAQRREFAGRRTEKTIDGTRVAGWFTEDFTLAELKTLRARERIAQLRPGNARFDGQFEIPTFDEILALARAMDAQREAAARARGLATPPPLGVYPETKHPTHFARVGLALEPPLLDALRSHGYVGRSAPVFLQSFEVGNLKALRRSTELPLVQLIESSGAPRDLLERGDPRTYHDLVAADGLLEIAGYADAVGVEKLLVIPRREDGALAGATPLVRDAHAAGLEVHAWTFRAENHFLPTPLRAGEDPAQLGNVVDEVRAYLRAGIDGFFIDQPVLGVRAVEEFLSEGAPAGA